MEAVDEFIPDPGSGAVGPAGRGPLWLDGATGF